MKNNILRLTDHSLPEVWITPEKIHSGKHVAKIVRLNPDPGRRFRATSYFLERIRQLVEENLEDDQYGIADICRDAGVSRTQLHRNIRKHANTSTSIFIRNLRIQHGKLLLEHTDLNITQVAFAVGFKNPSYFSRLFSEMFHQSPRAYRKQIALPGCISLLPLHYSQ